MGLQKLVSAACEAELKAWEKAANVSGTFCERWIYDNVKIIAGRVHGGDSCAWKNLAFYRSPSQFGNDDLGPVNTIREHDFLCFVVYEHCNLKQITETWN